MSLEVLSEDLQRLLEPVADDAPAGRDLEGSRELSALEAMCLEPGDPGVAGIEPVDRRNWREIRDCAASVLGRSKDLRAAVIWARAALQIEGLPGLCDGIELVGVIAQRYWDTLYPGLDPDDGDATMRINGLQELVSRPLLAQLRLARVAAADGVGAVHVNGLLDAHQSVLARVDLPTVEPQVPFAVFGALGIEALQGLQARVASAKAVVQQLCAHVYERTGQLPQLAALVAPLGERGALLDEIERVLAIHSERLQPRVSPGEGADSSEVSGMRGGAFELARREDVMLTLDHLCAYYARAEPSSPVPLLLQRAKRLAAMDFLEIMRDLADEGLRQVQTVAGVPMEDAVDHRT